MIKSRFISTKDLLDDGFLSFEVVEDCKALVGNFAFQCYGLEDCCIDCLLHLLPTTNVNQTLLLEQMLPYQLLIRLNQFLHIHLFAWIFSTLCKFYLNNSLFLISFEILFEVIVVILVLDAVVEFHGNSLLSWE